jgi:protein arginine kinase activator
MICEHCHKREATVHLTEIVNGYRTEKHLCQECAAQENIGGFAGDMFEDPFRDFFSPSDWFSSMRRPFRSSLGTSLACPSCGTTFSDIQRTGQMGCPSCYEAFREKLRPLFDEMNRSHTHTGKKPVEGTAQPAQAAAPAAEEKQESEEVKKLREELRQCIAKEEFEKAAELRDEIKKLTGEGGKDHDAE